MNKEMSFGEWFGLFMAVDGGMGKGDMGKVEWRLGQVKITYYIHFAGVLLWVNYISTSKILCTIILPSLILKT